MSKENALELLIKSAEAAVAYDIAIQGCADDPDKMSSYCTAQGDDLDTLYFNWQQAARAGLEAIKVSSATTNKAAEEGELPALPEPKLLRDGLIVGTYGYKASDMTAYARQAIAADRSSRQVANKAEVEVNEFAMAIYDISLMLGLPRGATPADVCLAVDALATPPATTGASTAHYEMEFTAELDRLLSAWSDAAENGVTSHELIREKIVAHVKSSKPVGASTVLTDERTSIDTDAFHVFMNEYDNEASYGSINKARNNLVAYIDQHVARKVAAQAGQNCFLSWGGKNVHGDEASIKAVKAALHDAGTVPELKDRIRDLQAQAGQVAVPGWISVDDRLPKDYERVLVLKDCGDGSLHSYAVGFVDRQSKDCWFADGYRGSLAYVGYRVTHWMPLPPSPAKESK